MIKRGFWKAKALVNATGVDGPNKTEIIFLKVVSITILFCKKLKNGQ